MTWMNWRYLHDLGNPNGDHFQKPPPAGRAKGKGWGKSKAPKTAMTPGPGDHQRHRSIRIDSARDELRQSIYDRFQWGFQEDQTRRLRVFTHHVFFPHHFQTQMELSPSLSSFFARASWANRWNPRRKQPGKLGNCDKPNQGVTQTLRRGKKKETTTEMVKTPKHNSYIWV